MKQTLGFLRTTWMASLAVVVGVCVAPARADVNWVTQPSSTPVTFSGIQGLAVWNYTNNHVITTNASSPLTGNDLFSELYTAVNQTDAGTSYNGFNNSMVTSGSGTLTTIGNNFLTTMNFGNRPSVTSFANYTPTTGFGISGNWLPNGASGGGPMPGQYGTATPAQAGFTLVGAAGTNQLGQPYSPVPGGGPLDPGAGPNGTGSAGRVSFVGTSGIANSNGANTAVTNGTFDGSIVHFTGVLGLAVNYQGDQDQNTNHDHLVTAVSGSSFFFLNGNSLGDISNNYSGAQALSTISRGVGANAYQYIMSVPYQADLALATRNGDANISNIGTAVAFDYRFSTTFTAIANLAKGDVNFDGVVNGLDIAAVASNWLTTNAQHLGVGDANGDGTVNGLDIALISSNWLQTTPPLGGAGGGGSGSAVPEPGTLALMGLGAVGLLAMRRRRRRRNC